MHKLALFFLPAIALFADPVTFRIDTAHSAAQFAVRHMMVSTVRGQMGKVTGTVVFDAADVTKSKVEASIDVAGINTRDEKRDAHLRSADFFDVAQFPTMTFVSTKVEAAGAGKLKVTGDLTMHGVTKSVVLEVEGPAAPLKQNNSLRSGAVATTKLNRQDFGVKWSRALDAGGVAVADEVTVTIDLEMVAGGAAR